MLIFSDEIIPQHTKHRLVASVATADFFPRSGVFLFYLGFWGYCWKSGVFNSGQIFEMYAVLLYFPLKNTIISYA